MARRFISEGGRLLWQKALKIILERREMTFGEMAEKVGSTSANLGVRIRGGRLLADQFFNIIETLGCEIRLYDSETGVDITEITGAGRSVRKKIGGVMYDTDLSIAVSNDFYEINDNKYNDGYAKELYKDRYGRYFFALYSNFPNDKDTIETCSPREAKKFIEKHGTTIFKGRDAERLKIVSEVNGFEDDSDDDIDESLPSEDDDDE